MDINDEKMLYLYEELKDYEASTPMNDEERKALREWVDGGHSVHDNGRLACLDGGELMDFLDVYRQEKEENDRLLAMSESDREAYLLDQYGVGRSDTPPTYDALKERLQELYRENSLYFDFVVSKGLWQEAEKYISQHKDDEMPFDAMDWF